MEKIKLRGDIKCWKCTLCLKNGGGGAPENKLLKGKFLGFVLELLRFKKPILLCHPEGETRRIYKNGIQEILRFAQNDKKCAFTMAEVLITLGIIGIVIAMTLPSIIGKYQKKVTAERLKQTYSILSQAFLRSQVDNGEPREWNLERYSKNDSAALEEICKLYIEPYLQMNGKSKRGSLKNAGWKSYHLLSGEVSERPSINNSAMYIMPLANGVSIMLSFKSDATKLNGLLIYVDINGPAGPNISGIDGFCLSLNFENAQLSFWNSDQPRDYIKQNICTRKTGGVNTSLGCGALIFKDNWEIREDYPWK